MDLSKRANLTREVRDWSLPDLELRAGEGDTLTLTGEASVVDHPYTVRDAFGEFTETIAAGAFDKTLSEHPDVMLLVNHQGLPLARTTSGTLKLNANPNLGVNASLDAGDPDVQRVQTKMKRGDLNEMSFAFRVTRQSWNEDYTDRVVTEVNLNRGDVSVVNYGANPATTSSLRSLAGFDPDELDDALAALRDGEADETQRALVERMIAHVGGLLATEEEAPAGVPDSIWEDLAALAAKFPAPLT